MSNVTLTNMSRFGSTHMGLTRDVTIEGAIGKESFQDLVPRRERSPTTYNGTQSEGDNSPSEDHSAKESDDTTGDTSPAILTRDGSGKMNFSCNRGTPETSAPNPNHAPAPILNKSFELRTIKRSRGVLTSLPCSDDQAFQTRNFQKFPVLVAPQSNLLKVRQSMMY